MGKKNQGRPSFPPIVYLALAVVLMTAVAIAAFANRGHSVPPDLRPGGLNADLVRGDLVGAAAANRVLSGKALYPSFLPRDVALAGIVRDQGSEDSIWIVYDQSPLTSGEFHLLDMMRKGGVILLEEPSTRTVEEQEAWVAYVIEETEGKVERVNVNGHVGSLGHGEIPQLRWWQNGLRLILFGFILDDEFLAIAQSVQPSA